MPSLEKKTPEELFSTYMAISKLNVYRRYREMYGTSQTEELGQKIKKNLEDIYGKDRRQTLIEINDRIRELANADTERILFQ